ncbi:hypothetical protein IWX49DRAFT_196170 [Phyllosticta citricarpa]|uniref:Uncharacterized protein n=2 Tax=Phyllosticta TaxID=121621 RepID=A0ABR1M5Q1_9PEZI
MGIPGIYKEIGPGIRVALAKLAVQKFDENHRPLRIAIDTAIWLVQIQSSKGGTNPAMRTFFYRLLRLMKLSVQPLFVFDGPNKPSEKRNKKTGQTFASIPEYFAKQVLKKFGFPFHDAPGEAEAECALLQTSGIVDMVLSEDVDTLMFGSRMTIRPSQDQKSGKSATHFNLYDSVEIKTESGLDREGMILVAMMSGGDYLTEGIPGCGPKVACEAARAGFGKRLCQLPVGDKNRLDEWKLDLAEELRTNKSKYFKTKHASLALPEDFPRMKILRYYTHPATSSPEALERLRLRVENSWDREIDLAGVRELTVEVFKWQGKTGAKHFIRNLAPALLPRALRLRGQRIAAEMASQKTTAELEEEEGQLVVSIHGHRQHFSTDQMDELRVTIVPSKIVPIDMDAEDEDNEESLADIEADLASAENPEGGEGSTKRPTQYDPDQLERHWVMDSFVKCGVPIKVEDWQEAQRRKNAPKEKKPRRVTAKKPPAKGGMPLGALDRFTTVTKSNAGPSEKPTRAKSPSVERLDLSGIRETGGQRTDSLRPQKDASGSRAAECSASMPNVVNLCSSPVEPVTEKSHSFSETADEHYLSPNITKRARTIRRTKSANDPVQDEPAIALPQLGRKRAAASNSKNRSTAGSSVEDSPSKRQASIEESLRSWHGTSSKRHPATLPSLDEVEQVDLTISPIQLRADAVKNAADVSTVPTRSRNREALSSTSNNTTVTNSKRQPARADLSSDSFPKPSLAGSNAKMHTQRIASPAALSLSRIDNVFGSSKKSAEAPKKRAIKVRESLEGGWMFVDRDTEHLDLTGSSQESCVASSAAKITKKSAAPKRKAWRESGVEMLDLTGA